MAVLYAYFDESGKFKDQKVVSFGGVIGPHSTMDAFDRLWRRQLRKAGLNSLTMKDALRSHVPLSDRVPAQSPKDRIRALEPFAACIRDHAESVIAIALDVADYYQIRKRAAGKLPATASPHLIAYTSTVYKLLDLLGPSDQIGLICDDDEEMALPSYELYRRIKKNYAVAREKLACLSFADDAVFLPLQAADMVSSLVRLEARKRFFGEPYEYSALYELIRYDNPRVEICYLDEKAIIGLGESFVRRKTASAFGFPPI